MATVKDALNAIESHEKECKALYKSIDKRPTMRKRIFSRIKSGSKGGGAGQWSARKAQMLAKAYKKAGGGYK